MKKEFYATIEMSDYTEGSVTLSDNLIKELKVDTKNIMGKVSFLTDCKPFFIFMYWNPDKKCFSFSRVKQGFALKAQCEMIAYNPETKEYGFQAINPTVQYMFYRLKIDAKKVLFKVETQEIDNLTIYNLINYEVIDNT